MSENTSLNSVKVALAGAGVIGKRHLAVIGASNVAELTAIVDANEAAQILAHDKGVAFYRNMPELVASAVVEGVIVATPTEHHYEPTMAALDAKLHVLVEKPVMPTLQQAEQITKKSASTGMQVLVGHQRRYYAQIHKARELIQSGLLGQLIGVRGI